uniref:IMV heparin binding surface protein n=1 Tax=Rousettus bat poxvirus TaxID=3141933 RepID=A0AAU7E1I2_9POXV
MAVQNVDLFVVSKLGRAPDSVVPSDVRKQVTVNGWTPPYTAESPQAAAYFSTLCSAFCTPENKRAIVQHLTLWRHISGTTDVSDYVIVVEDDNTVTQQLLDTAPALTAALAAAGIDVLQLTGSTLTGFAERMPLTTTPPMYAAPPAYPSLQAYIIRRTAAALLHNNFVNRKVSTGLTFELGAIERATGIKHLGLEDNATFVFHEYELTNKARIDAHGPTFHQRVSSWFARNYPESFSAVTTPVFSLFGKVNVSVSGLVVLLLVVLFIVFDVRSRVVWFIVGMIVSWSIQ